VFWIAIVLIVLMGVVPPWTSGGHAPIFAAPERTYFRDRVEVDIARLLIQWVLVAGVGGALIWTLKTQNVG